MVKKIFYISFIVQSLCCLLDSTMNESQPAEHQFYCLRGAIAFIEENPIPQDNDQIDVIEVPPKADAVTDQEDFDDEIVDGRDKDPLYFPPDVPGSVELHQFHEDETASTEAATQPKKKNAVLSGKKCNQVIPNFPLLQMGLHKKQNT